MPSRSIPPAAVIVNRPAAPSPVVVSVPHAGRIYPPEILAASRVEQRHLERLEDGWCDLIAAGAVDAGGTIVQALWARAVADCNRGEGQMAPGEVEVSLRSRFSAPGRKERAGLGVVPTRLADCGPLWTKPIDEAALQWRLDSLHRPYHTALTEELAAARDRFGHAILIDLHSMPSIPPGQPGHGSRMVIGDHFGATAGESIIDLTMKSAEELEPSVARNQPYAGGHIIRTHGRPVHAVHAVQIEIDRSLYLTSGRLPDAARVARLAKWFSDLVTKIGQMRPAAEIFPQAAE